VLQYKAIRSEYATSEQAKIITDRCDLSAINQ